MSIANTPGTYPVTIIAAELGDVSNDGTKPALRLVYEHSTGTIEQILRLYAGAKKVSLEILRDSLDYTFQTGPEILIGKECKIKTEDKYNEQEGKTFYTVKGPYPVGAKMVAAPKNLLAQLAAEAKALPATAPRPPRAAGPAPAARRPAPASNFADDGSVPF
jgi:hypothetical protein